MDYKRTVALNDSLHQLSFKIATFFSEFACVIQWITSSFTLICRIQIYHLPLHHRSAKASHIIIPILAICRKFVTMDLVKRFSLFLRVVLCHSLSKLIFHFFQVLTPLAWNFIKHDMSRLTLFVAKNNPCFRWAISSERHVANGERIRVIPLKNNFTSRPQNKFARTEVNPERSPLARVERITWYICGILRHFWSTFRREINSWFGITANIKTVSSRVCLWLFM